MEKFVEDFLQAEEMASNLVETLKHLYTETEKYILNKKTRKLQKVLQEFYYVGVEATVKESFLLYKTKDLRESIANLRPKSIITILLCIPSPQWHTKNLYLIKSEHNLLGWCDEKTLVKKVVSLPFAD